MAHELVETDLVHLEQVVARISASDHIPLSYWRKRVHAVLAAACVPSQLTRAKALIRLLDTLETRGE